jgi:uncharacterized membrane protein (DUF2068 family)
MAEPITRASRPFGLYAIIILQGITVIAFLIVTVWAPEEVLERLPPLIAHPRMLQSVAAVVVALFLINAAGLWWLRRWAWQLTMIVTGASLLTGIIQYYRGNPAYLQMVTDLFIVLYLNQRNVQRCFERRRAPATERIMELEPMP